MERNMKIIAVLVLLAGTLFAQSAVKDVSPAGSPIAITGDTTNVAGKNVSSKEILAYFISFKSDGAHNYSHDNYFSTGVAPGGEAMIAPLTSEDRINLSVPVNATVTYVQFVDGTEWGDHDEGTKILEIRSLLLQFNKEMLASATSGLTDFTRLLTTTENDTTQEPSVRGMAAGMRRRLDEVGLSGVIFQIRKRLIQAAAHDKTLNP
jgi:hypothetical protein